MKFVSYTQQKRSPPEGQEGSIHLTNPLLSSDHEVSFPLRLCLLALSFRLRRL